MATRTRRGGPITEALGIDLINRVPLDRAPGVSYEYSNANYDLRGSFDKLDYGYGWVRGVLAGQLLIWHNGEVDGFAAMNEFFPKQGITIIVLSNVQDSGADGALGVLLAKMMLGLA